MSQAVANKVRNAGLRTVVVSDTHKLAPWADLLYSCDASWWVHHAQSALRFAGLKVTHDEGVMWPQVMVITARIDERGAHMQAGFDPDPSYIRTGDNSGYQAVHIALHTGAKRILLCGFDMRGSHFFGDHPPQLGNTTDETFKRFIGFFEGLSKVLPQGVEVINCTPGSALQCFRFMDLDEALYMVSAESKLTLENRMRLAYANDED